MGGKRIVSGKNILGRLGITQLSKISTVFMFIFMGVSCSRQFSFQVVPQSDPLLPQSPTTLGPDQPTILAPDQPTTPGPDQPTNNNNDVPKLSPQATNPNETSPPNSEPTPSPSPHQSASPYPSAIPSPAQSPAPSPSTNPNPSPSPHQSPSPYPSAIPSPSPTVNPSPGPSPSPSPSTNPNPSPFPSPTASPKPDVSPLPSPAPSASPEVQPSPQPSPGIPEEYLCVKKKKPEKCGKHACKDKINDDDDDDDDAEKESQEELDEQEEHQEADPSKYKHTSECLGKQFTGKKHQGLRISLCHKPLRQRITKCVKLHSAIYGHKVVIPLEIIEKLQLSDEEKAKLIKNLMEPKLHSDTLGKCSPIE